MGMEEFSHDLRLVGEDVGQEGEEGRAAVAAAAGGGVWDHKLNLAGQGVEDGDG